MDGTRSDADPPPVEGAPEGADPAPDPTVAAAEGAPAAPVDTVDLEDAEDDPAAGARDIPSLAGEIPWRDEPAPPFRVAFVGGKGGAGSSLVAANVAVFLSRLGREVVVADVAAGGSNLHTYLGLAPLLPGPASLLRPPGRPRVERVPGMTLRLCRPPWPLTGGWDAPLRRDTLGSAVRLDADLIILDLGAGADPLTIDSFLEADAGVVVVPPEPAGVERTYAFLRAALYRRLLHGDDRPAVQARAALEADEDGEITTPPRLVAALAATDPEAADAIRARVLAFSPLILVNKCRTRGDAEVADGIVSALRRRWGVGAEALGALEYDDAAWHSARRRRPLLIEYPGAGIAEHIERLARRLLGLAARHPARV